VSFKVLGVSAASPNLFSCDRTFIWRPIRRNHRGNNDLMGWLVALWAGIPLTHF
jgi:hypothetical protein